MRTDCRGKVVGRAYALPTTFPLQSVLTLGAYRQATRTLIESDGTICCMSTTVSS